MRGREKQREAQGNLYTPGERRKWLCNRGEREGSIKCILLLSLQGWFEKSSITRPLQQHRNALAWSLCFFLTAFSFWSCSLLKGCRSPRKSLWGKLKKYFKYTHTHTKPLPLGKEAFSSLYTQCCKTDQTQSTNISCPQLLLYSHGQRDQTLYYNTTGPECVCSQSSGWCSSTARARCEQHPSHGVDT